MKDESLSSFLFFDRSCAAGEQEKGARSRNEDATLPSPPFNAILPAPSSLFLRGRRKTSGAVVGSALARAIRARERADLHSPILEHGAETRLFRRPLSADGSMGPA